MKGFWDTWLHIGTGLSVAAAVGMLVFGIYSIGRVDGRAEVFWTRYEKGYEDGYKDRSLGFERQFKPSRN